MAFAALSVSCALAQSANTTAPTKAPSATDFKFVGARVYLAKAIDAKKLKVGDLVLAKLQYPVHLSNGIDLPQEASLLGHVNNAQLSLNKSDSAVSLIFDNVQFKNGREIPIRAIVLAISPAPNYLNPAVSSTPADRTTPGVGVTAGMSSAPPSQGNAFSGTTKAVPHTAPASELDASAPASTAIVQRDGIPGVSLQGNLRGPDSGTFTSSARNVYVPQGTLMVLVLAPLLSQPAK